MVSPGGRWSAIISERCVTPDVFAPPSPAFPRSPVALGGVVSVLLVACAVGLAVGGCVSRSTLPEAGLEFRLAGRIALAAEEGAVTANYVWRQYADNVEIDLWGPLGQGRTRVVGEGTALTVHTADGARLDGEAARSLVRREFGLAAPVELLSNWILGRPAPDWPVESLGEGAFAQLGWHVALSGFRDIAGRRVPGRLVASRGARKVTVLCREWRFAPGPARHLAGQN